MQDQQASRSAANVTHRLPGRTRLRVPAHRGDPAFFAGARAHIKRHAFGNPVRDDLLDALEETSGRDLKAWTAAWYSSPVTRRPSRAWPTAL